MEKFDREYLYNCEYSNEFIDSIENKNFLGEEPSYQVVENALLLPPKFIGWGPIWCKGGGLDASGNFIEYSAARYMKEGYEADEVKYCDEEVYYFGLYFKQWGHFILEFISTLWLFQKERKKYENIKIVYLPMFQDHEMVGNFLQILELIGIKKENLIKLEVPTRFKRVIFPQRSVAMTGPFLYSNAYRNLIDLIIENACKIKIKNKFYDKIYLSRQGFIPTLDRDFGEEDIEKFFNANGYKTICMEKLSVVEQIQVIQNAKFVACTISSNAHNLIFAKNGITAYIVNKMFPYNEIQYMVDDFRDIDATFIDSFCTFMPCSFGSGSTLLCFNSKLKKFAKEHNMKIPRIKSEKDKLLYYLSLYMKRIESIKGHADEFFSIGYENSRNEISFYTKNELILRKYYHELLFKFGNKSKKAYHKSRYEFFKDKLKSYR